jgi:3-hydroxyisobutyrate dehydrogenase-like beta-hydroxyacid dehydrogenase
MSATPTVAVVAPGNMGAGVGRRLAENKVTVLTSLAGRSEESAKRAREAGMQPVEDRTLAEADFFLSIIPPGDALGLAKRLAPVLTAANKKPVYVDCNAVSPPTVQKIADEIAATGCPFVGAGIIGPPPKPGSTNTKIYASGPAAADFAGLNDYGLIVRVLDGPVTAASALKMSYAGITKGFTALGHDARRDQRRFGRRTQGGACREPTRSVALPFEPGSIDVFEGVPLGGRA